VGRRLPLPIPMHERLLVAVVHSRVPIALTANCCRSRTVGSALTSAVQTSHTVSSKRSFLGRLQMAGSGGLQPFCTVAEQLGQAA
jgi:hypothetical protein